LKGYRSRQQSTQRHDFVAPKMALFHQPMPSPQVANGGGSHSLDYSNDKLNTE